MDRDILLKRSAQALTQTDPETSPSVLAIFMDVKPEQATQLFKRSKSSDDNKRSRRLKGSDDRVLVSKSQRIEASLFGAIYEQLCLNNDPSKDLDLFVLNSAYLKYVAMRQNLPFMNEPEDKTNPFLYSLLPQNDCVTLARSMRNINAPSMMVLCDSCNTKFYSMSTHCADLNHCCPFCDGRSIRKKRYF